MIEDEELLELPDDPELAFVEYERKLREWLRGAPDRYQRQDWEPERDYVNHVLAFLAAHDLHVFDPEPSVPVNEGEFAEFYRHFVRNVDYWTIHFRVSHAARVRKGIRAIVRVPPHLKQEIHHYINKIRQSVEEIDLRIEKKEAILVKLNALADEVDRDTTRTEALMSLALEVADTGGEIAKKLAPARQLVDSLTKAFAKAKELTEQLGLPQRREPKRIEGPKKRLLPPNDFDDLDDEIPF